MDEQVEEIEHEVRDSDSPNEVLDKLRAALKADGDFPVRAKVVTDLRKLVEDPNTNVNKITEVILKEPALGTRVLSLVNSAFYTSNQPIMTITQAVHRLGMKPLSNLCSGFVLMNRFAPAAKRGGFFTESLKKSIIMSLIAGYLLRESREEGMQEEAYLAGTFYNLGHLLLAFYFPQVYEAAGRRAAAKNQELMASLHELLGLSAEDLTFSIVESLQIPEDYHDILRESYKSFGKRDRKRAQFQLSNALASAERISHFVLTMKNRKELFLELTNLEKLTGFSKDVLTKLIFDLPEIFNEHCKLIEMSFLKLPDYILSDSDEAGSGSQPEEATKFGEYIDEIKEAIEDDEPLPSIITSAMEALVYGLGFDRAVLFMADEDGELLYFHMNLGKKHSENIKKMIRHVNAPGMYNAPDIAAFRSKTVKTLGGQIFADGWPFAALPVGGIKSTPVGVLYADIVSFPEDDVPSLDSRTIASLSILLDLLDEAVSQSS